MEPDKSIEEEKVKVTHKDTFRFIQHYLKDNKWLVIISVTLLILSSFAASITPVYTGEIVDAMVQGGDNVWNNVWRAFWLLVGIGLTEQVLILIAYLCFNVYALQGMRKMTDDVSFKVQRFSSEWHENSFSGGTIRKVTRGMFSFNGCMSGLILTMIPTFFLAIGIVFMLSFKNLLLGLVLGAMVVVYLIINIFVAVKVMAPKWKETTQRDNEISSVLGDVITANQIVKSFAAEKIEDKNIKSTLAKWQEYVLPAWHWADAINLFRHLSSFGMMAVVISLVVWTWKDGNATPGDITVVITATFILSGHIMRIGDAMTNMQRSFNELEDVVELWLREDDVCDVEDALPLVLRGDHKRNKIAFEDVGFIYPRSDIGLFKKLAVKIADGEKVALVGTSGSGKSTFIKLLQRMYNINEGQIRIDGQDISKVTLESLRQSISLVPQDPILFHRSLKENIAYGKPDASMEEIVEASKKAYIHDFISTLTKGYETEVGERGIKLSGGERQRVAIARAILADKPILVLDEATSSLDSVSEQYIKQAMEELVKGKTTITVAHRLSTVRNSDRILVFSKGKIIEQGKHDELMQDKNSQYKNLYDTQSLGIVIRDGE